MTFDGSYTVRSNGHHEIRIKAKTAREQSIHAEMKGFLKIISIYALCSCSHFSA